jgi:hypothetical protein
MWLANAETLAPNVLLAVLAVPSREPVCHVPMRHYARATGSVTIRGGWYDWVRFAKRRPLETLDLFIESCLG